MTGTEPDRECKGRASQPPLGNVEVNVAYLFGVCEKFNSLHGLGIKIYSGNISSAISQSFS